MPREISLIFARDSNNGIGVYDINTDKYSLPWLIPEDLQYFKEMTTGSTVIMGKNTWNSLNKKLKNRINIIISNSLDNPNEDDCRVFKSLDEAIKWIPESEKIFIIGGSRLFKEAIDKRICSKIYVTQLHEVYPKCNIFGPVIDKEFIIKDKKSFNNYSRYTYELKQENGSSPYVIENQTDKQYKELIEDILINGSYRKNRTDVPTYSLFGPKQMRFSLENNNIPLLTTKKVFWRGVVEELLWFLSGSTDANKLSEKGIRIWSPNASREFLDKTGLHDRNVGQLGPSYGHQWRRFGSEYINNKSEQSDYGPNVCDQIKILVDLIKNDPTSRRLILSAWSPPQLGQVALPPCHVLSQFYVSDGKLSCQLYQRSGDVGLGIPFNIASYSLLTIMLAHCTGLKPGTFIHVIGDAHIYETHVEPLKEQIKRNSFEGPKLFVESENKDIFSFKYEDFKLNDYVCHDTVKMDMIA